MTTWHPHTTTPPAPGLYIRNHARTFIAPNPGELPLFARWDGQQWMVGYATRRPACLTQRPAGPRLQNLPWRELAEGDLTPDIFEVMA